MLQRFRQPILFVLLGAASFGLAFLARSSASRHTESPLVASPPSTAPDSVRLAAMGFKPGRQLVAYVFVSSDCSYCQLRDTKEAITSIRELFRRNNESGFRSATVVGVDLDTDIGAGLGYLNGIGLRSFDEISVGQSWLNENLVRLVWRDKTGPPSVPQVIILSRDMSAKLKPLNLSFGTDSVVGLLTGRKAILKWVQGGATIQGATPALSAPEVELQTTTVSELGAIPTGQAGR
jgi:hypothetical protein